MLSAMVMRGLIDVLLAALPGNVGILGRPGIKESVAYRLR